MKRVYRLVRLGALLLFSVMVMTQTAYAMDSSFVYGSAELQEKIKSADSAMKTAHVMAECARALPIEDEDAELVIEIAKNHYAAANDLKELYEIELSETRAAVFEYDAYTITNLSKEAFDYILAGTNLDGMGYAFEEPEQAYGVNGLFALAIAKVESGMGRSALAVNKNNFFGMIGNSYDTKYDGIIGFGRLMNKPLYQGKSISRIAVTYCPPTADAWASSVRSLMGQYWTTLDMVECEETADAGDMLVYPSPGFLEDLCRISEKSSELDQETSTDQEISIETEVNLETDVEFVSED